MTDRCPKCGGTDVADLGYEPGHEPADYKREQVCLDYDYQWGKP